MERKGDQRGVHHDPVETRFMSDPVPIFGQVLDSWLETLEAEGFHIGVREHLSIQILLARVGEGQDVDTSEAVRERLGLLAPLLCTSGESQKRYGELLGAFLVRQGRRAVPSPVTVDTPALEIVKGGGTGKRPGIHWGVFIWLALLVIGGVVFFWGGTDGTKRTDRTNGPVIGSPGPGLTNPPIKPLPPPATNPPVHSNISTNAPYLFERRVVIGETPVRVFSWSISAVVAFLLGWMAWAHFRRSPYLRQARTDRETEDTVLFDRTDRGFRLELGPIRTASRALRRRVIGVGQVLDPAATIQQSIRSNGVFTPRFRPTRTTPEYVALIDRRHHLDHFAKYATDMVRALQESGVAVEVLYFEESPALGCWVPSGRESGRSAGREGDKPSGGDISLNEAGGKRRDAASTLVEGGAKRRDAASTFGRTRRIRWGDIVQQAGGRRLLVFAEASVAVNPATGGGRSWTTALDAFGERAWLTPVMDSSWRSAEGLVDTLGFLVLPAVEESMVALGDWLGTARPVLTRRAEWPGTYPTLLAEEPISWVACQSAPPPKVLESLLLQLGSYLGSERFQWLCGTALFPVISPTLTWMVGRFLATAESPRPTGKRWLGFRFSRLIGYSDPQPKPSVSAVPTPERGDGRGAVRNERTAREQSLGFRALSVMPFCRYVHLPDWFREELIQRLTPENERRFRELFEQMPAPTLESSSGEELARIVREQWGQGATKDVVLVEFLRRDLVTRLAQRLPVSWQRLLFPRGSAAFGLRPEVVIAAVAVLVFSALAPGLWTQYGYAPIRSKSDANSLGMRFVPVAGTHVQFSIWETRVRDYAAYAQAAGVTNTEWQSPAFGVQGFTQTTNNPVVNVRWEDAQAFCAWLTLKERQEGILQSNQRYRLPTDLEWSAAVGLTMEVGMTPSERNSKVKNIYPWGTNWPPTNYIGNFADDSFSAVFGTNIVGAIAGYHDGYPATSPVGSFAPQTNGIFDLSGNVWEWCEDRYDEKRVERVLRGGSWVNLDPDLLLSSYRFYFGPGGRINGVGFRVVMAGDEYARSGGLLIFSFFSLLLLSFLFLTAKRREIFVFLRRGVNRLERREDQEKAAKANDPAPASDIATDQLKSRDGEEHTHQTPPPTVFICYARNDNVSDDPRERWVDRLRLHLRPYESNGIFQVFFDDAFDLGENWSDQLQTQIKSAKVAVLLISPPFFASDYIRSVELPQLLQRAHEGELRIIPIILSATVFESTIFSYPDPLMGPYKTRLSNFKTVGPPQLFGALDFARQERALHEVAEEIAKYIAAKADEASDNKVGRTPHGLARRFAPEGKLQPLPTPPAREITNSLGMRFAPVPGTEVMFCIWPTRVLDYAAFVAETHGLDESWRDPHYEGVPVTPGPTHPVVNVSWEDAKRFCEWLTLRELKQGRLKPGERYRLPTDLEWSAAVGLPPEDGKIPADRDGKIAGVYPWGKEWPPPPGAGNFADETSKEEFPKFNVIAGYRDGFATTSPVGAFRPSRDGLFDLSGNVWEWCEDRYYEKRVERVLRGGSWGDSYPGNLLSSFRGNYAPGNRFNIFGFRVVMAGDEYARLGGV